MRRRKTVFVGLVVILFTVLLIILHLSTPDLSHKPNLKNVLQQSVVDAQAVIKLSNLSVQLNYNIHIFYYVWYGSPPHDKTYVHWNHRRIPHWDKTVADQWSVTDHKPPDDIAASFYPLLGPYSSRDPHVIHSHMKQLVQAGVGVLVVSWYPPGFSDDNGNPVDHLIEHLLDIANIYSIKVAFHIEPYPGRNATSVKSNIIYIFKRYGSHDAFYRTVKDTRLLPIIYIYDSYLSSPQQWKSVLSITGKESVRGTQFDAIIIGLVVKQSHKHDILNAGFDGYYTYFAADKFTFGSTHTNWPYLAEYARTRGLLFIPSIGPGYIDTEVRPWNTATTRSRHGGVYYESSCRSAVQESIEPTYITITSFNEWHEGTQIEKAIKHARHAGVTYLDYAPNSPDFYLKLTKKCAVIFSNKLKRSNK